MQNINLVEISRYGHKSQLTFKMSKKFVFYEPAASM